MALKQLDDEKKRKKRKRIRRKKWHKEFKLVSVHNVTGDHAASYSQRPTDAHKGRTHSTRATQCGGRPPKSRAYCCSVEAAAVKAYRNSLTIIFCFHIIVSLKRG